MDIPPIEKLSISNTFNEQSYTELLESWPFRIATTKRKGRHAIAKQDLQAGTIVLLERATSFIILSPYVSNTCCYCLKSVPTSRSKNFACQHCSFACYCSSACATKDRSRHQLECKLLSNSVTRIHQQCSVDLDLLRIILGLLVQRVLDSKRTEKYHVVEGCRQTPFEFSEGLVSNSEAFSAEWKTCITKAMTMLRELLPNEMRIPVEDMVLLAGRINSNSHGFGDPFESTNRDIAFGLCPISSIFNHSCEPNCTFVGNPFGILTVRTLRPIKKGEELCFSYVDLYQGRDDRRHDLATTKFFYCECDRCGKKDSVLPKTHKDVYLDGVVCKDCGKGVMISEKLNAKEDEVRTCSLSCGGSTKVTEKEFNEIQMNATRDFSNAYQHIRERNYGEARKALEAFMDKYESSKILHPFHYHLFNALIPLMNCCNYQEDLEASIKYNRLILKKMEESSVYPPNYPEVSDFWFSLGETMEKLAQKLIAAAKVADKKSGSKSKSKKGKSGAKKVKKATTSKEEGDDEGDELDPREILKQAKEVYERCSAIRLVCVGDKHPKFLEAYKKVLSL